MPIVSLLPRATSAVARSGLTRQHVALTVLLFVAASLVITGPSLLRGQTLGGTDILQVTSPYREELSSQPTLGNPIQTDQLEQIPLVSTFWRSLRQGDLQLWDSSVGMGIPLGAVTHNRVLAPWNVVLLVTDAAIGITLATTLALICGMWGMYLLSRRLGIGVGGSRVAAVVYVLSGPAQVAILRIHEVILFPIVLYAIHGALTASDRRGRRLWLLAGSVAALGVAGFPSAALYAIYATIPFTAVVALGARGDEPFRRRVRAAVRNGGPAGLAVLTGTALASVQTLYGFRYLRGSGAIDRVFTISDNTGTDKLATFTSGRFFGSFPAGDWWLGTEANANPYQASFMVGAVATILLALLVTNRRMSRPSDHLSYVLTRYVGPMALIVLVAVSSGGPLLWLLQRLPFVANNSITHSRYLAAFAVALLAGAAIESWLGSEAGAVPAPLRWQVGPLLALVAAGTAHGLLRAAEADMLRQVGGALIVPSAVAGLAGAVIAMRRRRGAALLLCALAIGELGWGLWGFTPRSRAEWFYPETPEVADLRERVEADGKSRFGSVGLDVLPPHAAMWLDVPDVRVSFPSSQRYRQLMEAADPAVFERRRLRTIFTTGLDPGTAALDAAAVRFLVQPLDDRPLEIDEPVRFPQDAGDQLPSEVDLPPSDRPARWIVVGVERLDPGCEEGWVELDIGDLRVRRLVREVDGVATFPVPDLVLSQPTTARIVASHCAMRLAEPDGGVHHVLPDASTRMVEVGRWVLYERPTARPRVELVQQVLRVDDPTERLAVLARRDPDRPTLVEGVDLPSRLAKGRVAVVSDNHDEIVLHVDSQGAGFLVLRDAVDAGWTATVDGEPVPIVPTDHAARGVQVPQGSSEVIFRFFPEELQLGLLFAALGTVALLALTVKHRLQQRRGTRERSALSRERGQRSTSCR